MIRSVLVANRGEIARRVFRTCRDLGIRTVAVHSDADADAPFVQEADIAVPLPGNTAAETYLRGDLVIAAAKAAGADAIHPGYGFLSENADFARQVAEAGLTWIGPTPESIEAMGSKIRAKELMAAAGVPILEVDPAKAEARDFPLLVKASAGGGGRGMRVVETPADLERELAAATAEAESAFGDGTVFVEPYLPTARHVEVQVVADTHGTTWILGDRDCSIQRRHQKVVEEAPAPNLSDATREVLHTAARDAAEAVDYVGAGTVEFLVDGDRPFFLEMNTRLQVEHPVTEAVFGVDLVAAQIAVAEGRELGEPPAGPTGHSIEVRLYAEDAADDWSPQTGVLRAFETPDSVRVDSAVESGSVVSHFYDPMIAKVVAYGADRHQAIRVLDDALRRTRLHGLVTNRDLLRGVLADDEFAAGNVHTALLGERIDAWTAPRLTEAQRDRLVLAGALAEARASSTAGVLGRFPTAYRNVTSQPRTRHYVLDGQEVEAVYTGSIRGLASEVADVVSAEPHRVVLRVEGVDETYRVDVGEGWVDVDGPHGAADLIPVPAFVDPADVVAEGSLLAPMPATVTSVAVEVGQRVAKGETVLVLEAMKMQHTLAAPTAGVITEIDVATGQQVESGAVLAVIESEQDQK
ncbi:MAG: biotin carboxylase N-terminal domain-containing protein [Aeromicrobium sp.]|uniref:acetyl/propionyl/methylcrotonyl-CoA carboxylase subunit alpha n=1 Tax=Aeromicrobium sp. TaxID=1871063 RepID=UPI0039E4A5C2